MMIKGPSPDTTTTSEISILSRDHAVYTKLLQPLLPLECKVIQATDDPAQLVCDNVTILLGDPDLIVEVIERCHQLQWCQSCWAGNAPLLKSPKKDYHLTGVKTVFGQQMREYVFAHILYFSRHIETYIQQQSVPHPKWTQPTFDYIAGKTLGIVGAGSISDDLLPVANAFDMRVIGLSQSGKPKSGFNQIFTVEDKLRLAQQSDFVVSLLPDTQSTYHVLDERFFAAMKPSAVLINAGRGNSVDEVALIKALDANQLRAAVLDVFKAEPLADDSELWRHPKVIVTQHTAAISKPEDIVRVFTDNLMRWQNRTPLMYEFDFAKGY